LEEKTTAGEKEERMMEKSWSAVDAWLTEQLAPPDAALDAALEATDTAGMPPINVSPMQGKLLHLVARSIGARTILEIGTLGGYSTIWLARALPADADSRLISLEINAGNAEVARRNLANAGLADRVEIRLGPALETLPRLQAEQFGPIDLAFIDADKQHNVEYVQAALELSHPGSLIIVDNVIRHGHILDTYSQDPSVQGTRRLIEYVANEPRLNATAIQTVGSKGYDGFLLARVE
jgi:predicted O-methyltransferase YrrM